MNPQRHYPMKDVSEHATVWWCPVNQVQILVCTDDESCESCGKSFEEEAQERSEAAVVAGEARYRQSVLGDEA